MTDEQEFDRQFGRDDELRALLAGADPAPALVPADEAGLARLLEDTMSHDTEIPTEAGIDAGSQTGPAAATGTEGRNPLTWLVAAAAVFIIAGVGFFATAQLGGEEPPPPTAHEPTVTALAAPPAVEAKCAVPTGDLLATQELAFAGTVTAVEGDTVTLETTTAYAGEVGDVVEVTAPAAELQALLLATEFEVGGAYLVSASGGQVSVCGFSGAATPQLEQLYQEAFPG